MVTFDDRTSGRENNFNLVRMIAAMAVLTSHAWPIALGKGTLEPLQSALGIKLGTAAVYVFFAISGFFITKSFDKGHDRKRFVAARVLRLYPRLSIALILTVLFCWYALPQESAADYWGAAIGYVLRNLSLYFTTYGLPGVFDELPYPRAINGSLWTLFYEVTCYAGVFLLGILGVLRRPVLIAGGVAALFALSIIREDLGLPSRVTTILELGLPFALGSGAYLWRQHIPLSTLLGTVLTSMAIVAFDTRLFSTLFVLALSYWSLALGFFRIPALLAYNRLGDYSYGTYIYAFPIQQIVAQLGIREPLTNITFALPLTLICAVLSWHFVERPSLQLVKHTA